MFVDTYIALSPDSVEKDREPGDEANRQHVMRKQRHQSISGTPHLLWSTCSTPLITLEQGGLQYNTITKDTYIASYPFSRAILKIWDGLGSRVQDKHTHTRYYTLQWHWYWKGSYITAQCLCSLTFGEDPLKVIQPAVSDVITDLDERTNKQKCITISSWNFYTNLPSTNSTLY